MVRTLGRRWNEVLVPALGPMRGPRRTRGPGSSSDRRIGPCSCGRRPGRPSLTALAEDGRPLVRATRDTDVPSRSGRAGHPEQRAGSAVLHPRGVPSPARGGTPSSIPPGSTAGEPGLDYLAVLQVERGPLATCTGPLDDPASEPGDRHLLR